MPSGSWCSPCPPGAADALADTGAVAEGAASGSVEALGRAAPGTYVVCPLFTRATTIPTTRQTPRTPSTVLVRLGDRIFLVLLADPAECLPLTSVPNVLLFVASQTAP